MRAFGVDFLKSRLEPEAVARIERKDDALVKACREDAEEHFRRFAPRIDFGKLKADGSPCPEAFEDVGKLTADCDNAAEGIYIFGKAQSGKTCAAVAAIWNQVYFPERRGRFFAGLLEAEVYRTEFPKRRFNGDDFQLWAASDLRDKFNDVCRSMEDKTELFGKLNAADYLLIDDLGQTLSTTFAENLRLVLERRTEVVFFITSNYSPRKLIERWSGKRGSEDMTELIEGIVGRILRRCAVIEFKPTAATKPGKA